MVRVEDPNLPQLRSLLTLAEELHFGRAAARRYLTQPALSQQIRSLERRLGVPLFNRTSRRVEMTPAGRALMPLVKSVVVATDELCDAAHPSSPDVGVLRVGLSDCAAPLEATRRVIATLAARHPDLQLDFRGVDMVEQVTALSAGRLDAAFAYLPVPDGFGGQPLTAEARVVCVSQVDPLAHRHPVRLADLAGRPVVSLAPEVSRAEQRFWAVDPRPDGTPVRYSTHRVTRVETLLSAVSLDGAIAFLPAVAAELYPRPDVRYLAVEDLSPCTFGVVWPAADPEPAQVAALRDVCRLLHHQGLPSGT